MIPRRDLAYSQTKASIEEKLKKEQKAIEESIEYAIRNGLFSVGFQELSPSMKSLLEELGYTVEKVNPTPDGIAVMRGADVWKVSWNIPQFSRL